MYSIGDSFSPGSYPNAKTYELSIEESELINLITDFKEENSEFKTPKQAGLRDHKSNHWYIVYFYLPEDHEIILTWTRPSGKNTTTWALVSVVDEQGEKWRKINNDIGSAEKRVYINKFESQILRRIKEKIDSRASRYPDTTLISE